MQQGARLFLERVQQSFPVQEDQGEESLTVISGFSLLLYRQFEQSMRRGDERGQYRYQRVR